MENRSQTAPRQEAPSKAASEEQVDLRRFFDQAGTVGSFVLLDDQTGAVVRYDPARAAARFFPASTFKIPNSLIAMETGVADGPEFRLAYDPAASPPRDWWPVAWSQDQTMRTAIRDSVVWYYQELARRIGRERMQSFLDRFDYGNRDITGPIDRFWLNGPLSISADEQVRFLRRFYHGQLGLSERTTRMTRDILLLKESPQYRLSGKSGTYEMTATREFAWHVGYVERGTHVWFYALNMDGERVWEDWPPKRRVELVEQICRELGVIEED